MPSRAGRPNYPWARMVSELRERPGKWRLFPEMVGAPLSVIYRIRAGRVRAFRSAGGKVYARRGTLVNLDGDVRVDVWLRLITKEDEHA